MSLIFSIAPNKHSAQNTPHLHSSPLTRPKHRPKMPPLPTSTRLAVLIDFRFVMEIPSPHLELSLTRFFAMKTVQLRISLALVCAVFLLLSAPLAPAQSPGKKSPPTDPAVGKKLFERHCALCHGIDGKGGRGPALNRVRLSRAPDDDALKSLITDGIPPVMPDGWFFDDNALANLAAYVRSLSKIPSDPVPGDAAHGAEIYARSACSTCHMLNASGSSYGPDLTAIGERRSPSFLAKILAKPSDGLPEDFLFVRATTSSGQTIEGLRANEDSFTIQIKDPSGRFHSFRKSQLSNLQKLRGETPMPSFAATLPPHDLQDLVAFLAAQRGPQ
jgi:cytochrome c oxidase cbb3-type subunit 3